MGPLGQTATSLLQPVIFLNFLVKHIEECKEEHLIIQNPKFLLVLGGFKSITRNVVTNTKSSLCLPKLETVTQSFSEECGEEHHSLGIQNPAIDQKSLHVCAEVLMCIAACVYYCVIGFVSRQGTQCSLKSYCRFLCSQEQINDRTCTDSTLCASRWAKRAKWVELSHM